MTLEEAREFFSKDAYAAMAGIVIDEIGEHYAKCSMPVDRRHMNASGFLMGGATFTLADFVFAVSSNTPSGVAVNVVSQISYLGSCRGSRLIAESRLLKDGRRNCFYQVTVSDDLGNPVASVTINGVYKNPR